MHNYTHVPDQKKHVFLNLSNSEDKADQKKQSIATCYSKCVFTFLFPFLILTLYFFRSFGG